MRDENDEPIYTHNNEFMRHFVRQSINGGRCGSFNQYYKSSILDDVFIVISEELNVNGNICESLHNYFEYTNKLRKKIENEYDSQFDDYRDNDQEGKTKFINKKLSKLKILEKLRKLNLNDVKMKFDTTSLYPSAMYDEKSVYLKIETGFAFKPHMKKNLHGGIQQSNI